MIAQTKFCMRIGREVRIFWTRTLQHCRVHQNGDVRGRGRGGGGLGALRYHQSEVVTVDLATSPPQFTRWVAGNHHAAGAWSIQWWDLCAFQLQHRKRNLSKQIYCGVCVRLHKGCGGGRGKVVRHTYLLFRDTGDGNRQPPRRRSSVNPVTGESEKRLIAENELFSLSFRQKFSPDFF